MEKVLMSTNFIKAIDQTFYGFTSMITHLGCWKRTQEKLVNHEPKGSCLQSFHLNGHIIGFCPQTQKLVPL